MGKTLLMFAFSLGCHVAAATTRAAEASCNAMSGREIGGAHITAATALSGDSDWKLDAHGYSVTVSSPFCADAAKYRCAVSNDSVAQP
jgi:hypothetical protein